MTSVLGKRNVTALGSAGRLVCEERLNKMANRSCLVQFSDVSDMQNTVFCVNVQDPNSACDDLKSKDLQGCVIEGGKVNGIFLIILGASLMSHETSLRLYVYSNSRRCSELGDNRDFLAQ